MFKLRKPLAMLLRLNPLPARQLPAQVDAVAVAGRVSISCITRTAALPISDLYPGSRTCFAEKTRLVIPCERLMR